MNSIGGDVGSRGNRVTGTSVGAPQQAALVADLHAAYAAAVANGMTGVTFSEWLANLSQSSIGGDTNTGLEGILSGRGGKVSVATPGVDYTPPSDAIAMAIAL